MEIKQQEEILAKAKQASDIQFDQTIARVNLVGNLMNWRTPKSNATKQKVLEGFYKTQNFLSRFKTK
jgi:hypothetical protein